MTKQPPRIELRLEGPAVPGRISVDILASVAKELQTSLRRLLSTRHQTTGRFPAGIEQACKLDLTAFAKGSAQLTFELAQPREPSSLFGDEGLRVATEMLQILEAGEEATPGWSDGLQPAVLDGFDRLTKPLGDGGVDSIRLRVVDKGKSHAVTVTNRFRAHLQVAAATLPRADELSLEGVIWECDWKEHTALLFDIEGNRVILEFPASLEELITSLRRRPVRIRGRSKGHPERGQRVEVASVSPLALGVAQPDPRYGGFWDNLSVEELIRRQGVQPVQDIKDLACDWPEDESVDEFLESIRQVLG